MLHPGPGTLELNSAPAPKQVYVHTFGCQMNALDSDKMVALLGRDGYARTERLEEADLVLINTCSIREKAEHKLYSLLGRLRDRPGITVGITGCVAQQEGEVLLKRFPFVNLVMGPDAIPRVSALVQRAVQQERILDTTFHDGLEYPFINDLPLDVGRQVTAFVTIQKGCDNKCTFCIVPTTRGVERSRPADDILLEIQQLVAAGVREITLLGQNVNSYGLKMQTEPTFAQLLTRIDREVDGLKRLRFTTSHPRDFGEDVIEAFATLEILAPYLHLPVQSGSNRILKRMKRYHTIEDYRHQLEALKRACPDMVLTTDFIVGFPGETEADFEQTMDLLREVRYDACFSFMYSPRPGTPALKLKDDVPLEDKKRRLAALQTLQRTLSLECNQAWVGRVVPVLVEGSSRHHQDELSGRTPGNKTVNFPGRPRLIGHEVPVRITEARINSLRAELVLH